MNKSILFLLLAVSSLPVFAQEGLEQALKLYAGQDAFQFDAERGKAFWNQINITDDGKERSCNTCHGDDLSKPGKHVKTGKVIAPMTLSANPKRYTKLKKIKKWFKRNCKWTVGRECSNQEKGDILTFLSQQ